jgi:hypothetical protein
MLLNDWLIFYIKGNSMTTKIIEVDLVRMFNSSYEFLAKRGLYKENDTHAVVIGTGTAEITMLDSDDNEINALERLKSETIAQQKADLAIIQHKINKLLRVES